VLPPWLIILLFFLAVYRASRFIGQDTFPPVAWVRWRLVHRRVPGDPEASLESFRHDTWAVRAPWLEYLLGNNTDTGCPWCISLWVALFGSAALWFGTHWHWWVLLTLWWASSAAAGLLSQLED
jgi:uncharacterized protein DUF1360